MREPLPPTLEATLKANMETPVNLVVYTRGPAIMRQQQAEVVGFHVRHVFHLTNCLAVTGPARVALTLANEDWVDRIEEDQEMHTLTGKEEADHAGT